MATSPDERKAALLEATVARVRERVDGAEADDVERFVRAYYAHVAPDDLSDRSDLDLYGAALAHWNLARVRQPGETKVHVYTPNVEEHGWESDAHRRRDRRRRHALPRRLGLDGGDAERERDPPRDPADHAHAARRGGPAARGRRRGRAARVADPRRDRPPGRAPRSSSGCAPDLCRVLGDVRAAVEDWPAMRERVATIVAELDESRRSGRPGRASPRRATCSSGWTTATSRSSATASTRSSPRTGRTCCAPCPARASASCARPTSGRSRSSFAQLPPEVRRLAREKNLLNLTKANSRATVHRPAVPRLRRRQALRRRPARCRGERRFLGLYTHTAYSASPWEIPVLRRKAQRVVERLGAPAAAATTTRRSSRSSRPTRATSSSRSRRTSSSRPRSASSTSASAGASGSSSGGTRSAASSRASSTSRASASTPRTGSGSRTSSRRRSAATSVDYTTRVSESVLARLHVVVYTEPGAVPEYDVAEIEARLAAATRAWTDDLRDALLGAARRGARAARSSSATATRSPAPTARTSPPARPCSTSSGSSGSTRTATSA